MATPRRGKRKFGEKAEFGEGQSSFGESMARPREAFDNPEENPLKDVPVTGDLEVDSAAEMKAVHDAMIETRRKVDRKVKYAIDGSFYMTIVWLSRQDRDAFMRKIRMDKSAYRGYFLDGYQLTRQLDLDVDYPTNERG